MNAQPKKYAHNKAMHADTQPRRAHAVALPEIPWRRGCMPVMASDGADASRRATGAPDTHPHAAPLDTKKDIAC